MKISSVCIALLAVAWLVAGCGVVEDVLGSDARDEANNALNSLEATVAEAALLIAGVDGADPGDGAEGVAEYAAGEAETQYSPADCVQALRNGSIVTYTLENCSGPLNTTGVSGVVVINYSVSNDGELSANLTGNDVAIDGNELTLNMDGDYSVSGDEQSLSIRTGGGGRTDDGTVITRAGTYTIDWSGANCYGIGGQWNTTQGDDSTWATVVSDYAVCGGCPEDGGRLTYTGAEGFSLDDVSAVTITFDGNDDATYVGTGGAPGSLDLSCN